MSMLLDQVKQSDSIYMPIPARVTAVTTLTAQEKLFTIELPYGLSLNHEPGQFVQVTVFGVGEAPISISSSPSRSNGTFELCIRKVGDLTNVIHRLEQGAMLGIRGPFGRGFPVERFRGKDLLFVCGGLGMAPLRSLLNEVLDDRGNYGRVILLYGARQPADLLFQDELAEWEARDDVEVHLTVDCPDNGWDRCVGVITKLFPEVEVEARNTVAVVVGPPVMYRFVLKELKKLRIPKGNIWFSFERRMKCGVGKCGHCQLNHVYTCQSGPSFNYAELEFLEGAFS
ncbi:MAG: FAD/NAD(P)-binding protein [Anaerolineales bacterium]|nr:FAD/NAD(P)-binding protein [Anaerolineales bacterium]